MKYLFVLLTLLFWVVNANKPRLYTRIPKFFVDDRVSNFLNQNRITNCFEFRESETNLLLKCWRDNKLTDVSIDINPGKRKYRPYYGLSVSV
jgi:hypothetical protein